MLIGGDDISNDVITLGACFHAFFTAQSTGSHRGIGGGIQIFSDSLPAPPPERPGELARRLATKPQTVFLSANPNPDF